jgi:tetratricopeptide (TPR) repeat protein
MNRLPIIAVVLLSACSSAEERAVERALHAGASEYRAERYAEAAEVFASGPADVRLAYNRGNAHHRQARYDEAVTGFLDAERMSDSTMIARSAYNLGTARLWQARKADSLAKAYAKEVGDIRIEGDDIARKVDLYVLRDSLRRDIKRLEHLVDSALKAGGQAYRTALINAPSDEDARHNLVAAKRLIAARDKAAGRNGDKGDDEKKELGERAKMLLAQAEELVEQFKFAEALELLRGGLKQDPSLEQRKDYMEKLDLVTKAASAQ